MNDYGTALAVLTSLPARFAFVDGPVAVAYSVARRWQTARGSLPWAPEVGVDVTELLGQPLADGLRAQWQADLRAEALADERVEDCTVVITAPDEETLQIAADLSLLEGDDVSFRLVVTVDAVTIEILRGLA